MTDGGYAWWYVDVLSDDGTLGLTFIVFVGSVFSPWYAAERARTGARVEAATFPAVNVALYRPGGDRWVMTERPAGALTRSRTTIDVGASRLAWEGDALVLDFDESCATFPSPLPARLRGRVRLVPRWIDGAPVTLAPGHRWSPIAPSARAEVTLEEPALRFSGEGYLDANSGDEPLEAGFMGWNWSRMATRSGTLVAYHSTPRAGAPLAEVRRYDRSGRMEAVPGTIPAPVPRSRWGVARAVVADPGSAPRVVRALEDTPFYARTLIETRVAGETGLAIHEALDAQRFASRWVQFLLPFRARRE